MEKPCFQIVVFILVSSTFSCCFGHRPLSITTDEEALVAFKSRITSDPSNMLSSNWSTNSNASICSWIGVSCGAKQRITALWLFGWNLEGTLSPYIGNLTFLTSLDLSFNRFTGPIPKELARLHRLKEIFLGDNTFTGNIIPSLFNLESKLEIVNFSYNSISGNIPKEIGNLSRLKVLDLKYNQLTGPIPSSFFNISSLEEFDLTNNSLSGIIPGDMCENLSKLAGVFLSLNQLSGSIPSNLYKCKELQQLSLSFNWFNGSIPTEIGKLTKLRNLYLGANEFRGGIPREIGNLSNLEILSIQKASLTGNIPSFIFNMSSLKGIDLAYNNLSGAFPLNIQHKLPNLERLFLQNNQLSGQILSSLVDCKRLWQLQLEGNHFSGLIPKRIGNMTQLKILSLSKNKMTGEIPSELSNLINLERIDLDDNNMFGEIPSSIFNISTLIQLELSSNHFTGYLPVNIGSSLPNLNSLLLAGNRLTGPIPSSINNASKLSILDMGSNTFTGLMPHFGSLRILKWLLIPENNLTGDPNNQELGFISSLQNSPYLAILEVSLNPQLNGIIPRSIGNLSRSLLSFRAFGCNIKGSIPVEIGNLTSLISVTLDQNKLSGVIPSELGKLKDLQVIYLEYNRLEGQIPKEICQANRLSDLYLSGNMLVGTIPGCLGEVKSLRRVFLDSNKLNSSLPNLWNLSDVWSLNLSTNFLSGSIPSDIENMKALINLDISRNHLSGSIPSSIGSVDSLVNLSLAHNGFQGSIPPSLGNLRGLEILDLSHNNFSGSIPKSLEGLRYINYFDVSHNRLEGEIPTEGCFQNFTSRSFMYNHALCGVSRFHVPPCKPRNGKNRASLIKYIVGPIASTLFIVVIALWCIRRRKAKLKKVDAEHLSPILSWRRVSYQELVQATEGFADFNLLGSGSFGSVFKGTLSDGLNVAVKVFDLHRELSSQSFDVESEVLSNVRHRNLVRVISCCNNLDFKALVFEYMPNGSLEKWLYSHNYCLDLIQRLEIAIDVASALEYLHHCGTFPIVHCDLKPSNVLLDGDMTAHVGDFGISKLFGEGEELIQTITMATVGYMAPEYGSEGKVSTHGDVYSYGIMLLEIFTRKKPTDDMFGEEMSLKHWVREAVERNAVVEVVAPGLLASNDQHFHSKRECISSIFRLAMACLASSPQERVNVMHMVAALKKIKIAFLASTTTKNRMDR